MTDKQYIVRTPSKEYNGKTAGIQFYSGAGLIAPHTIDPFLGRTADEIADIMAKDFGYDVQEVAAAPVPLPEPAPKRKTTTKRKTRKDVTK